jgi:hypothetical protein
MWVRRALQRAEPQRIQDLSACAGRLLGDVLFCASPTLLFFVARATMARAIHDYLLCIVYIIVSIADKFAKTLQL